MRRSASTAVRLAGSPRSFLAMGGGQQANEHIAEDYTAKSGENRRRSKFGS